jgi:RNA polymerase sigma-70 factor (ECF subfamily)
MLDPPNLATNVDPLRATLAVTFDRPMDREGWSWVIEGPESAPDLGEAAFDAAGRTNTVVARLLPGRTYVVWVNSQRYSYFRSAAGVPAEPLRWTFTTRGAAAAAGSLASMASPSAPPRVVLLDPPNGATGVDPAKTVLRATFDRPMEEGWSWIAEGDNFPETAGKAYLEADSRTAAMPVRLQPGRTYVVWLNSEQYQMFRDRRGIPAPPLRWVFSTRPAG